MAGRGPTTPRPRGSVPPAGALLRRATSKKNTDAMTLSKRRFLQLVAVQTATLALVACGDDSSSTTTAAAPGAPAGGAAGSLAITGTSNIPSPATAIVPNDGLGGASASRATVAGNLLNVAINSLVNNVSRTLSVPLAGTAPPALNSTYTVVVDGNANGSALTLVAVDVLANKNYFFSSESGTVKITALSATSVDLLFTNVTLGATAGAQNQSATGKVILNGTVTVARA